MDLNNRVETGNRHRVHPLLHGSRGYDDCAAFFYKKFYYRDYSPKDTKAIHEAVKTYIVPLLERYKLLYSSEPILVSRKAMGQRFSGLSQEDILDMTEPYMVFVSSELSELYAYMRRSHLADIAPAYRYEVLYQIIGGSINGSLFDELQQRVFAEKT